MPTPCQYLLALIALGTLTKPSDAASSYMLGPKTSSDCGDVNTPETTSILDYDECCGTGGAAESVGLGPCKNTGGTTMRHFNNQNGCFYFTAPASHQTPGVWFNTYPGGNLQSWNKPICKITGASTGGDPKTWFNGTETQFVLPENQVVPVLKQRSLGIFYKVTNPLDTAYHAGADWINSVGLAVEGAPSKYINISVIPNPSTLVQPELMPAPFPGAPLSTMVVSVGGQPLMTGVHTVKPLTIKATFDPDYKRIGQGYKERVDVITEDFHIRVTSAKAKKFENEEMQVKALHLDVTFYKFDQRAVRGVLPEIWGLAPMSKETVKLLKAQ